MAKIGLNSFKYSKLTEATDGTPSYEGAKSLGKAIDCKVSIEKYSAELYADDSLAENDNTFKKGTVTLTLDEDDDTVFAEILGHTIAPAYVVTTDETKSTTKEYYTKTGDIYTKFTGSSFEEGTTYYEKDENGGETIRKDTDVAPYVGIGRILTKVVNGVYKYKVEFLPKVKFSEPEQEEVTKGDSIEFKTPSVEGTVTKLKNGTWSKCKTFTDKNDASEYLDNLLKVPTV